MTINEFYKKYKGRTNLKIAQMEAIETYFKHHSKVDYENLLDNLKHLYFITKEEYIDLNSLEEEK